MIRASIAWMADRRPGRGAEPRDEKLFGAEQRSPLRAAVADLAWLLDRGYPPGASLALVGNRHELTRRQRKAVRGGCAPSRAVRERRGRLRHGFLEGAPVQVDGFNVVITTERALAGGPVFIGLDGAKRDIAGVHGSYRMGRQTDDALLALGRELEARGAGPTMWLLDRPVSNSGRLARRIRELAETHGWTWEAKTVADPDRQLVAGGGVVATSDAFVLDRCEAWIDLTGGAIARAAPDAWLVDLRRAGASGTD